MARGAVEVNRAGEPSLTLVSTVAKGYIQLRALDRQLK
jgi:hypothetical protein